MASRSSNSTRPQGTTMSKPSERSRSERPRQGKRPTARRADEGTRGPAEKKHKNMAEVAATGRQSDQGGKPGGTRRSGGR